MAGAALGHQAVGALQALARAAQRTLETRQLLLQFGEAILLLRQFFLGASFGFLRGGSSTGSGWPSAARSCSRRAARWARLSSVRMAWPWSASARRTPCSASLSGAARLGHLLAGELHVVLGLGQAGGGFLVAGAGGHGPLARVLQQRLPAEFLVLDAAQLPRPVAVFDVELGQARLEAHWRESRTWLISDSSRLTSALAAYISACAACSASEAAKCASRDASTRASTSRNWAVSASTRFSASPTWRA